MFNNITVFFGLIINYIYGYNTSLIKNDNRYNNQEINNYNDAINFIKKDCFC